MHRYNSRENCRIKTVTLVRIYLCFVSLVFELFIIVKCSSENALALTLHLQALELMGPDRIPAPCVLEDDRGNS